MLTVGDKVVYPMHGAGVIEGIEAREIKGTTQDYFVLTMLFGDMRVMIPVHNVDHVGLRPVIASGEVSHIPEVLEERPCQIMRNINWNRRFNFYLDKMKQGDIFSVAEVVRNLLAQDRVKKLSTGERRLLSTAKQILVSELMLSCSEESTTVESWLDKWFVEPTQEH